MLDELPTPLRALARLVSERYYCYYYHPFWTVFSKRLTATFPAAGSIVTALLCVEAPERQTEDCHHLLNSWIKSVRKASSGISCSSVKQGPILININSAASADARCYSTYQVGGH